MSARLRRAKDSPLNSRVAELTTQIEAANAEHARLSAAHEVIVRPLTNLESLKGLVARIEPANGSECDNIRGQAVAVLTRLLSGGAGPTAEELRAVLLFLLVPGAGVLLHERFVAEQGHKLRAMGDAADRLAELKAELASVEAQIESA
jgi:uncharacterized protein YhaN